jgi:flagellar hook-associated protein 1 FlgK
MASLSSALNYALAGLSVSTAQSALVARNISSAGDENFTRKTAEIHTLPSGAPSVSGLRRSTDRQVLDKLLLSNSDAAEKQIMLDALARMSTLSGDPQNGQSIPAALGQLKQALRGYESNPASNALARSALEAARTVALKLNASAAEAASIRNDADSAMAEATQTINTLLAQFKVINDSIIRGQGTPDELAENLDQRDSILKLLSAEIGIRTATRPNNDVLIYAEGGAVLFEGLPRKVSFTQSTALTPGAIGNPLYIDGVAVTGAGAPMPVSGGRIAALADIRDRMAVQFSVQLDQIAAGLMQGFAEKDPGSAPLLPDVEGLFTATGTLPATTEPKAGLSSLIRINPMADPSEGGSLSLLRDGGFGGAGYVRNTQSLPGFQARLSELADALERAQPFSMADGVGANTSLISLSLQSASWVGGRYQDAQTSLDAASARQSRSNDALARITGVSIDQEMATLLDLEKSYQASSKVLGIVNSMMATLIEAVG